ncbi:MAG: rRNA pseudouridine synthase, partial [Desulfitobacterium sp.]|nr:rRNA pseudouridine synthase [Desulfitobacterium sp.]
KKVPQRVYPVGRLDYNSSGLLLLTNDGEMAHRLMHPSFEVKKTYQVEVEKKVSEKYLQRLRRGIELEDGKTAPALVHEITSGKRGLLPCYEITIHEGRNRQVRRMFQAIGFPVVTLKRIRFGPVELDQDLPAGNFRPLTAQEIQRLKKAVKLKSH